MSSYLIPWPQSERGLDEPKPTSIYSVVTLSVTHHMNSVHPCIVLVPDPRKEGLGARLGWEYTMYTLHWYAGALQIG